MAPEPVKDTDPTLGKLVIDASRDISTLVSQEIELAKSELKVSIKYGGVSVGLFAAAGFIALLAIIALTISFAYFIHWAGLGLHWAYLIVFGAYLLIAGILALLGIRSAKKVKAPERAIAQGKQIPQALKPN